MEEVWKVCEDFPDYAVSSLGRVRAERTRKGVAAGKIHKRRVDDWGYIKVVVYKDGKRMGTGVHRLVAAAFIGPPPTPLHQVNHKNCVVDDNRVENLEWVTPSENMKHGFKFGSVKIPQNRWTKLTRESVEKIRCRAGESHEKLAQEFGVSRRNIGMIINRRTWK